MLNPAQKQFLYNEIKKIDVLTGLDINKTVNKKNTALTETNEALIMLCQKRGCTTNVVTPDDSIPIEFLKTQRDQIIQELAELQHIEYIKLQDILLLFDIKPLDEQYNIVNRLLLDERR